MQSKWKKYAVLLLAAVAAMCVMFAAACKTDVTFTFRVLDENGKGCLNVGVVLIDGASEDSPVYTNQEGYVEIAKPSGEYTVRLTNVPKGYINEETFTVDAQNNSVTFTLVKISTPTGGSGEMFDRYRVTVGVYEVTVKSADEELFYSFAPPELAKYAVFSEGSVDTKVQGYAASSATCYPDSEMVNDDVDETNKNFYLEFEPDHDSYASNPDYGNVFGITARADTYPVTFRVTFRKVGEATPDVVIPRDVVDGTNLPAYPDSDEELKEIPYDMKVVYNAQDGFYHVYSAKGPVLVAAVKRGSRYAEASFETMLGAGESFAYLTTVNGSSVIKDYNSFLYMPVRNEDGSVDHYDPCLIRSCNSDGVYGVTQDVYDMLHLFAAKYSTWDTLAAIPKDQQWLAFCYYYGTVGTGEADNPYLIDGFGDYEIEVPANGSVYYAVTFRVNVNNSYVVTCSDGNAVCYYGSERIYNGETISVSMQSTEDPVLRFSSADGSALSCTVTVSNYDGPNGSGTDKNPYVIGEGAYTALNVNGGSRCKYYSIYPNKSGKYVITFTNGDGVAYDENGAVVTEFVLESYIGANFKVCKADQTDDTLGDVEFTLTYVAE